MSFLLPFSFDLPISGSSQIGDPFGTDRGLRASAAEGPVYLEPTPGARECFLERFNLQGLQDGAALPALTRWVQSRNELLERALHVRTVLACIVLYRYWLYHV